MLPDSNYLPAPLWLITVLHIVTLTLHFAAMNFVVGGSLLMLSGRLSRRRDNPVERRFVALFPSIMAATVTLGVAPLLFLQLVYPHQVYASAIVSGWYWILIVAALIAGYYFFYAAAFADKQRSGYGRWLLWPALLSILYVSLAYSSVFSAVEKPALIHSLYAQGQAGWQWNPSIGDYLLRWLHMILGAVTVGAFSVGLLGKDDSEVFPAAKRSFLLGMLASMAAGLAYLISLDGRILGQVMRTSLTWMLAAGFLLSLTALVFFYRRSFSTSGLLLFVSLVLMVIVRHQLRLLQLQGEFDPASWRIASQWLPFALFLVCFLVAIAMIAFMFRLFFRKGAAVS